MTPAELEHHLLDAIPLAQAMELRVVDYQQGQLRIQAPLAPNRNDKGCAFGGSLVSLMTLAGWSSVALALGDEGLAAEIYVQDSHVRYLKPVWETIEVSARLADDVVPDDLVGMYRTRGRARTATRVRCLLADGTVAAELEARFVAIDPRRNAIKGT